MTSRKAALAERSNALLARWDMRMASISETGGRFPEAFSAGPSASSDRARTSLADLGARLQAGDVVFIRIPLLPFRKVADATLTWTNHVGLVIDVSGETPIIAESRAPVSGTTSLARFVQRSEAGRIAVARVTTGVDRAALPHLVQAASRRCGVLYDTGFNLHSRRQFCSRFVREVLDEATGIKLGEVEKLSALLERNPRADQKFWRVWYLGAIPWQRETVTPASLLRDARLQIVFDGYAK